MMGRKFAVTMWVVLLAGCSSLPLPDKTAHTNRPVQVDGAHGMLSIQESKTILANSKTAARKQISLLDILRRLMNFREAHL